MIISSQGSPVPCLYKVQGGVPEGRESLEEHAGALPLCAATSPLPRVVAFVLCRSLEGCRPCCFPITDQSALLIRLHCHHDVDPR